jgi:predicted transcriptional regulator
MTNREYLRNILNQLAGEVAALRPSDPDALRVANDDLYQLQIAINEAAAELERLDVENIEEAYHIKPIYDRIKAVIAHERVLRNQLDRVALAADNAIDLCNLLSAHVEEHNPNDEDEAL